MHTLEKPRRRLKLLAAATGVGAMAVLGAVTVVDSATAGATGPAPVKFSSTTTVTTPPSAPATPSASPAVKAPHK